MNIPRLANKIYRAIKCDANSCAAIRREFAALSVLIPTDPNASARVTSATVNGQTFSAQATMSQLERLELLGEIVSRLDNGSPISSTQLTTF